MCEFSVKTSCIGEMKQNINVRLLSLTVNNNETSRLLYIFGYIFLIPRTGKRGGGDTFWCISYRITLRKTVTII